MQAHEKAEEAKDNTVANAEECVDGERKVMFWRDGGWRRGARARLGISRHLSRISPHFLRTITRCDCMVADRGRQSPKGCVDQAARRDLPIVVVVVVVVVFCLQEGPTDETMGTGDMVLRRLLAEGEASWCSVVQALAPLAYGRDAGDIPV